MGSMPTKSKPRPIFQMSQFQQIEPNQCNYRSSYGVYTSYQNKITHQHVDKYQLQFNTKNQKQNYYQCFLQRFREEYIVNTIQFVDLSHRQFCSSLYRAQVFIQHIPIRLGDITDIPYPDNIYIIHNSLLGFQILHSMIGYFQVQEDHICINSYGEVKVWLNSNLSKNYPQDYNEQLKSQSDMVHRILNLIQSNTNIDQCPIQVTQYFKKKYNKFPNFNEALNLINQYTIEHKTTIPKYCQSVFEVFQESDSSKLKKQLQLYQQFSHSQSTYQKKSSKRNTIQVNDILIPRLDLPDVQEIENNNVEVPPKKSNTMRDTVKVQPSYQFCHQNPVNNLQSRYQFQKTQRLPYNPNRNFIRQSPQNYYVTNYYNQLTTKRSPAPINPRASINLNTSSTANQIINFPFRSIQSMKGSKVNAFLHGSQSTNHQIRPNVKFTYKSPANHFTSTPNNFQINSRIQNRQQRQGQRSQKLMQISNNTIQRKIDIYKSKETIQDKNKKNQQKINKEKIQTKVLSSLFTNKSIRSDKKNIININQLKLKTKSKQTRQKLKLQLFYYDTRQGPQLIDPQIAADLLKYL